MGAAVSRSRVGAVDELAEAAPTDPADAGAGDRPTSTVKLLVKHMRPMLSKPGGWKQICSEWREDWGEMKILLSVAWPRWRRKRVQSDDEQAQGD